MCQHNTQQSLVAAVWSDNCRVKTLSNYHEPIIVADGLMRKKMGDNDVQEKHQSPVNTPKQNNDYSNTFHQIDKGNMIESRYVLAKQGSKKHGWSPKPFFLLFLQYDMVTYGGGQRIIRPHKKIYSMYLIVMEESNNNPIWIDDWIKMSRQEQYNQTKHQWRILQCKVHNSIDGKESMLGWNIIILAVQ